MAPIGFSLLSLFSLTFLCIATPQERAPHGLVYENPVAFSPSAYNFFHPNAGKPETKDACTASKCSPLPLAAQMEATQSNALTSQKGRKQVGGGRVAGIVVGVALTVLLAMSVYYVRVTRRANLNRAKTVQPEA